MPNLILFILAAYGLSAIVIDSEAGKIIRPILKPVPILGQSTHCYMCFGFWSGLLCSPILWGYDDSWWYIAISSFLGGLAASAVCPFLAGLKEWLNIESLLKQMK